MEKSKLNPLKLFVLLLKGILVGFGAIMPGISGGALCVAFGMYQPVMNLLSHPFAELKKNGIPLAFFVLGGGIGFVGLSGLAGWLMKEYAMGFVFASIGFVLGTFPDMWNDAGKKGRDRLSYISMLIGFVAVLGILVFLTFATGFVLKAGFVGFLVCGVLWGLSFVVPGLSSSTLIMFFGLYQQMEEGIGNLDMSVVIPLGIGSAATLLALSKPINAAYKKWYSNLSHGIFGVVIAGVAGIFISTSILENGENILSTLQTSSDIFLAIGLAIGGAVTSFLLGKLCNKLAPEEEA